EKAIPVRLVLMPEADDFRALYPPATRERLDGFLRGLGAECIDARTWVPQSEFTDGHHLLRGGAAIFSERLTREAIAPFFRAAGCAAAVQHVDRGQRADDRVADAAAHARRRRPARGRAARILAAVHAAGRRVLRAEPDRPPPPLLARSAERARVLPRPAGHRS